MLIFERLLFKTIENSSISFLSGIQNKNRQLNRKQQKELEQE